MIDVVPMNDNERQAKLLMDTYNKLQKDNIGEWDYKENRKSTMITSHSRDMFGGEIVAVGMTMYDMETLKPSEVPEQLFITVKHWRALYSDLSKTKYGVVMNIYPLERMAKMAGLDLSGLSGADKLKRLINFCEGDPLDIIYKLTDDQVKSIWS